MAVVVATLDALDAAASVDGFAMVRLQPFTKHGASCSERF